MNTIYNFPWEKIENWYTQSGRKDLPWRDYSLPRDELLYRVWISEILLQQTQAERVIPFFEKILEKFPNTSNLSKSDYEEFFPYYQGLGYYSRARNILKTAKIIHNDYKGKFPDDKKSLQKLPGIWNYTASAILAFGYGKPFLAFDTNLEKIFSRFFYGNTEKKLTDEEKTAIENNFREFVKKFPENSQKHIIRNINNGLMDFARMIDSKNPAEIDWNSYPIHEGKFYETRGKMEVFTTKKQENFPIPDAKIMVILHENHKIYYSDKPNYTPFILAASENRDTRNFVKIYFKNTFNLDVSVRPVHKKWLSKNWEPFIAVNVQIQTGQKNFYEFTKKEAKEIIENYYEL